jgi:hypothetical protein
MFVTLAIGRCSLAPAETFATAAVTAAERRSGITTPSAPAVGGAQDRSQVVRILDSIEDDDQRLLAATRCHNVIEIAILFCRGRSHKSLMRGVAGNFVELLTRQNAHRNADFAALVDHSPQANILPLFGDADPFEVTPARLERFCNCINSVENVHGD